MTYYTLTAYAQETGHHPTWLSALRQRREDFPEPTEDVVGVEVWEDVDLEAFLETVSKHNAGRPKIEIDWEYVEDARAAGWSWVSIGDELGVSGETLRRRFDSR